MEQQITVANPFQLMLDPQSVVSAMERSERLRQLERHMCRPLDRPVVNAKNRKDDHHA